MQDDIALLRHLYDRFNARDIDAVLAALTEDVAWANAMDGGHEHGHAAIRAYWTRQWSLVSPHVAPLRFTRPAPNTVIAEVRQSVRDLQGNKLPPQIHSLHDKTLNHVFQFHNAKVARFDVEDAA